MFKKTLASLLAILIAAVASGSQVTTAQLTRGNEAIEKTRLKVAKIGTGRDARVEARLHDGTRLKGYVSAIDPDSFTITDTKSGANRTVSYADAVEVKKSNKGLSTRTWIILAGAATAAVIVGLTVIKPVVCDGGAGC